MRLLQLGMEEAAGGLGQGSALHMGRGSWSGRTPGSGQFARVLEAGSTCLSPGHTAFIWLGYWVRKRSPLRPKHPFTRTFCRKRHLPKGGQGSRGQLSCLLAQLSMAEVSASAELSKSSEKLVQCPLASFPGQAWLQCAMCASGVSGPGAGQPWCHQERSLWSLWWWHLLPCGPFLPWPGHAASALPSLPLSSPCEVPLSSRARGMLCERITRRLPLQSGFHKASRVGCAGGEVVGTGDGWV